MNTRSPIVTPTRTRLDRTSTMTNEERFMSRAHKRALIESDEVARRTVSFYRYVRIEDVDHFMEALYKVLYGLGCFGRIYVAHEGINAQMNVPLKDWNTFLQVVESFDELKGMDLKIAREETGFVSFYRLSIKKKRKIVADGLDDSTFDVTDTGSYLDAYEMNSYIEDKDAMVIDMRNAYETEVGHFDGAHTMQVDSFSDQLASVCREFEPYKKKKVALYCTGGIRCEKASAWMKHNGFENVRHLKGGIIDYDRQVKEQNLENKFRGKNFVFDERMGERIGSEVIATCHLCKKAKADTHYHCVYLPCHVLHIACDDCRETKAGYCSRICRARSYLPKSIQKRDTQLKLWRQRISRGRFRKNRLSA